MSNEKNGFTIGLLIVMSMLMLGMLVGGGVSGYRMYHSHRMALRMSAESRLQALKARDSQQDSIAQQAAIAVQLQEFEARNDELEAENAELRDHLREQDVD